jgi:hypothetical protein
MGRRKSKLSTLSIIRWFYKNVAIVLGIIPQSQRRRRILTKRCNRKVNVKLPNKNLREKCSQIKEINMYQNTNSRANDQFNHVCRLSGACEVRYGKLYSQNRVSKVKEMRLTFLFSYRYQYSIITIIVILRI